MVRKMILAQLGDQLASSTLPWNQKVLKYVEDLAIGSDQSTVVGYGGDFGVDRPPWLMRAGASRSVSAGLALSSSGH